jgi:hypothetical protein
MTKSFAADQTASSAYKAIYANNHILRTYVVVPLGATFQN